MYALVDCNSFFCSVEKVFHPGLEGKPVVVLSSNDGCIVALTPEAKEIGLHRGDPIFKVRDIVEGYRVAVFSTNMYLYAAMSKRVTNILRKSIQHVESLGIATSKTLAKMGSKFAKKYKGYQGVCMIDTDEKRRKALQLFDLSDVWGIGRQTLEKLNYYGIHTPLDFADKSESWVKSHLTKPGVQTWLELNGKPCIDTSEVMRKKTICTSRSFGEMVGDLDSLKSAVANFASSCANKLRGDDSGAKKVTVFLSSNRFREDLEQYGNAASQSLVTPTSDTMEITQAALRVLAKIYREGIQYKKAGVIVSDIEPLHPFQPDLFDPIQNRPERAKLMQALDAINHRYGLKTLRLAVEGEEKQAWKVKCEHRSPNYLTDINGLMVVGDSTPK